MLRKPFFFSLRLVFILGFQARLRLDTGRECCLEQNPSFFVPREIPLREEHVVIPFPTSHVSYVDVPVVQ